VNSITRRQHWLGLAGFLAACTQQKGNVVGVVPKGANHAFWQTVHAGAVKAGREFGFEVEWSAPKIETDAGRQIEIIESMINRKVSGIALAPVDSKALVRVVEKATAAGIPVAIFDSGIETSQRISFIATDNVESGRLAARRMGLILNGKGKVGVVGFKPGSASTMEREQGFVDELRTKFPAIQVLPVQFNEADRAKALAITENMLTAHKDLAGLFADNESSGAGAIQGLKGRNARQVKMIAYDANEQLVADMKAGWIDSIVLQDPFKMGYESGRAIAQKQRGEAPLAQMDSGARLVTAKDLDQPEVKALLNPPLAEFLGK
jgi:ribose transport system substrate-binding protein